jgi:hypothetical protein
MDVVRRPTTSLILLEASRGSGAGGISPFSAGHVRNRCAYGGCTSRSKIPSRSIGIRPAFMKASTSWWRALAANQARRIRTTLFDWGLVSRENFGAE